MLEAIQDSIELGELLPEGLVEALLAAQAEPPRVTSRGYLALTEPSRTLAQDEPGSISISMSGDGKDRSIWSRSLSQSARYNFNATEWFPE